MIYFLSMKVLETKRLILRTWEDSDLKLLYEINQDPLVMQYFPGLQDLDTTKRLVSTINQHYKDYGYTLYATVLKENNTFIGFIGLMSVPFTAHFTPAVEIGWRLNSHYWNKGYATEGARVVLHYAFTQLKLNEVVSFTVPNNIKSIRIMEKIGLRYDSNDDFDHPKLSKNIRLCRHILYRLKKDQFV